jgi:hypothetical protein
MAKTKKVSETTAIDDGLVQEDLTDDVIAAAKAYIKNVGDGKVGRDLYYMLKSRYRVLYIRTPEELRVIRFFTDLAKVDGSAVYLWDCSRGLIDANTKAQRTDVDPMVHESPLAVVDFLIQDVNARKKKGNKENQVFLLLDFHHFLGGETADARVERKIKEFSQISSYTTLIIVAPTFVCPAALEKEVTLVDFPSPSKYELKQLLDKNKNRIKDTFVEAASVITKAEEIEDDLIDAVCGLTLTEADNAFSKTLVAQKSFHIPTIIEEKRQMIKKSGVLEYCQTKDELVHVGGLNTLVDWLKQRRLAFTPEARDFGLPMPKGILLVGIPGCVLPDTKIRVRKISDKGKHTKFVE